MLAEGSLLTDGELELIRSSEPLPGLQVEVVDDGDRLELTARASLESELRVYGPEVTSVTVNGEPAAFTREGDHVVLNLSPTDPDGGIDAGIDAGPDGGADAGPDSGSEPSTPADEGCGCGAASTRAPTAIGRLLDLF